MLRYFSRFRLRAHHLRVESCKWQVVLTFVINVSVEKFKMRSMCFSFASVLKCARAAHEIQTLLKECLRLRCVRLLRRALISFLSWLVCLRFRNFKVWREANLSCPRAVNKKAVTCHKWCGSSESGPKGSPFSIPSYLYQGFEQTCVEEFQQVQIACTPFESGVLQMAWWL